MKTCLNCNQTVRDTDKFCRNCGCKLTSDKHYVLLNVLLVFLVLALGGLVLLFVASYVIMK